MQAKTSLLALAAAALLAACGGGSSHEMAGPSAANNEVPASATASPGAYTHFAASLEPSETSDPLDLRKVASPPTSETDLPQAL